MITTKTVRRSSAGLEEGFTIIELMIALSVLSTILLIASMLLIRIGDLYTKGVTTANLQNINRNITADLTSAIQFNAAKPADCDNATLPRTCFSRVTGPAPEANPRTYSGIPVYAYCVGNIRYSYVFDRELGADNYKPDGTPRSTPLITPHVLYRDTIDAGQAGADCVPLNITQADMSGVGDTADARPDQHGYEIAANHMRLTRFYVSPVSNGVYTVDIWLASGDSDLLTSPNADPTHPELNGKVQCRGDAGQQYCATSEIHTTVVRRLNNND